MSPLLALCIFLALVILVVTVYGAFIAASLADADEQDAFEEHMRELEGRG